MLKTVLTLMIIICLLASLSSFLAAKFMNQREIIQVKQELLQIKTRRDSLLTQVGARDTIIAQFEVKETKLNNEITLLKKQRSRLETERQQALANAFRLFQKEDIMAQMQDFWPEMARSQWGFKDIHNEEFNVDIEYFLIPTEFTTTFIQDHIDAIKYKQQLDKSMDIESLQNLVIAYKDTVIQLEKENKQAYKIGYDDAYTKYESLNQKYIKRLENPQIKLGVPALTAILGSAAAGFVAGTIADNK